MKERKESLHWMVEEKAKEMLAEASSTSLFQSHPDRLSSEVSALQGRLAAAESTLQEVKEEALGRLAESSTRLEETKLELRNAQGEAGRLLWQLEEANRSVAAQLEEAAARAEARLRAREEEFSKEISGLKSTEISLREELGLAREKASMAERCSTHLSELLQARQATAAAEKLQVEREAGEARGQLEGRLDELEAALEHSEAALERSEEQRSAAEDDAERLRAQLLESEGRLERTEDRLALVERTLSQELCEVGERLTFMASMAAEATARASTAEGVAHQLEADLRVERAAAEAARVEAGRERHRLEERLGGRMRELEECKGWRRAMEEEAVGLQERLAEAEGRLVEAEGRLAEAEGRLAEAEGGLMEAEGRLAQEAEEAEGARGLAKERDREVKALEEALREAHTKMGGLQAALEGVEANLEGERHGHLNTRLRLSHALVASSTAMKRCRSLAMESVADGEQLGFLQATLHASESLVLELEERLAGAGMGQPQG
ncbi:unnamed protein product, partial [Discosporangium mesarthrocarpum]